jgi:enoyl-CoA hydratase
MTDRYAHLKTINVEREGHLLLVELNRPHALNAVGDGMHEELEDLFALIRTDERANAVLLTGAGRAFCAGADMKELEAPDLDGHGPVGRVAWMVDHARRLVDNMLGLDIPIVAAVRGYALGMGCTLALFCDVVIASEDAVFADNHVSVGLVAGDGGTVIWPLLMAFNSAKYYLLTGDRVTGPEAHRLGLVHKCVPGDELLGEARAIAERFANGPSLAVRGTKRAVNKVLHDRVGLLLDPALALEGISFLSDDHQEASRAFVEKRSPSFRGC